MRREPKPTVLVVDDDASTCRALQRLLLLLDFNVKVFDSAKACLAGGHPTSDTCALVDVYMPRMSGPELCEKLAESSHPIPTILMSGRDDMPTRRLMREAKAVATVFKPFDEKTLLRAIQKALCSSLK